MKHTILALFTLHFSLFTLSASSAIPLKWTVETSRATPAQFEAYQGETLDLEAALQSYGKPLEAPSNYSLYWQTNGMGNAYWSTPCMPHNSNILFATWSPTNDVGARVYNCFIGQPGTIYHAAFQLRLRPSPGATPNELPLPQKVIDFAKVTVLNPPWSGGGGGGVDTNAVRDIIHATVDGAARPLPKYLHLYEANDSYPDAAAVYYRSRGNGKTDGGCSSVRDGGFLYRNFDYPFDERAEFVVRMSAGPAIEQSNNPNNRTIRHRFASIGVAQVGTNLTEQMVTSGKPEYSRLYKWLPGATVDGINENGVVAEINVVDGDPQTSGWHTTGDLHPLAAIRWILDYATNAQHAAQYLAASIRFPEGWTQNFHYMIADETATYIVENGNCYLAGLYDLVKPILTNFRVVGMQEGPGIERYNLLLGHANITNVWYTNAYRRETNPQWVSDLSDVLAYTNDIYNAWASHPKDYFRGKTNGGQPWWQTVHTSVYDISNRVLRVAVQETDDWYTFAVPSAGGVNPEAVRVIVSPMIGEATNCLRRVDDLAVYEKVGVGNWSHGELPANIELSSSQPVFENGTWKWFCRHAISGFLFVATLVDERRTAYEGTFVLDVGGGEFTATRAHELRPVSPPDFIAKESQLPTQAEKTVWNGKQDALSAAQIANIADVPNKRPLADNTCHDTEFTEWSFSGDDYDPSAVYSIIEIELPQESLRNFSLFKNGTSIDGKDIRLDLPEPESISNWLLGTRVTATRTAVCTTNKLFTTQDYVDGKVSDAVSTNNPAFVSAVRNTPTSGMPEDMPTDWGTYGTVGSALAALAAFVKWAKAKIVAVIGNDGKPTDTFATDLLGKQVANAKVRYALATTSSATMADRTVNLYEMNGNGTITFPTATTHEGVTYARDFLLRVKVTTAGSLTLPTDVTPLGDSFDFTKANDWLIAFTEIGKDANNKAEFYIRAISLEG